MSKIATRPRTKVKLKTERPRLHKVILINDDYTPREFVVTVLKAEFRMTEDEAHKVMITAHRRGVCVVAVFTRDIAETKATRATDAGRAFEDRFTAALADVLNQNPQVREVVAIGPIPMMKAVAASTRCGRIQRRYTPISIAIGIVRPIVTMPHGLDLSAFTTTSARTGARRSCPAACTPSG